MKEQKEQLFLQWFAEQYDVGVPEPFVFAATIAYLQGMVDAKGPDENRSNINQCISTLRIAECMTRVLKQYQVKLKD